MRRQADQRGREDYPHGGEGNSWACRLPKRPDRRSEAGIEKDDGKGKAADEVSRPGVVELEAQSIFTSNEANEQEYQEQGGAKAERRKAGEDRCHQQPGADQNDQVDPINQGCFSLLLVVTLVAKR